MRRWVALLKANKETETETCHASFKVVLWVVGEKALTYTNFCCLYLFYTLQNEHPNVQSLTTKCGESIFLQNQ